MKRWLICTGVLTILAVGLVGQRNARAHEFERFFAGGCCSETMADCTARPGHANPACQPGHHPIDLSSHPFHDFPSCVGVGCIGGTGACEPDIATGSVPEVPGNGIDDDCDGIVDEHVVSTPNGCCCQDLGGTCVARPGSPDPLCQAGELALTSVAVCPAAPVGCSCAGVPGTAPGQCIPLKAANATAEVPDNTLDDDCDGTIDDQGCNGVDSDGDGLIDEDRGGCLMRFLAVPQCWGGTDLAFRQAAQAQFNFFLTDIGVDSCRSNFSLSFVDPSTLNLSCGTSNMAGSTVPPNADPRCGGAENAAVIDTWPEELFGDARLMSPGRLAGLGLVRGNYDAIIGVTDANLCDNIAGVNMGGGFIWTETGTTVITSHEIAHSYDLADEYCSQEAGGDPRCAGGPTTGNPRINFLGSDLVCDPRNGNGCCNTCAATPANPNQGNYYVCCQGNQNPQLGRCTMSFVNAAGPRGFCSRCRNQLNTPTNPRSASNPSGLQPLSCTAVREVGSMNAMSMNMSVRDDGHLLAVKQVTFDVGRAALEGPSTHGRFGLEVRTASGGPLYATTFDIVNRDVTDGPQPLFNIEERGFRFVVPPGQDPSSRMKMSVSSAAGGLFFTTLNGTSPTVDAGADQTIECSSAGRGTTTLQGRAQDADGDTLNTQWSATGATFTAPQALMSAASFPVGITTPVTLSASDAVRPAVTDGVNVTVVDRTRPVLTAPTDIVVTTCTLTSINLGRATAVDSCAGALVPSNNAPTRFPLGRTVVTWRAVDAFGNVSTAPQNVTTVLMDDPSCCPAGTNIIEGTSASNRITGTSGRDCILGKGGDDVIDGRDGDDFIAGGAGRDTIFAGNGNDHVYGNDGDDTINAAPGNNVIEGGAGTDVCFVDPAHDTAVSCNP